MGCLLRLRESDGHAGHAPYCAIPLSTATYCYAAGQAEVDQVDAQALASGIVNLMKSDVEGLVDDAVQLHFLPADVDRDALLPPMRGIFNKGGKALIEMQRREQANHRGSRVTDM